MLGLTCLYLLQNALGSLGIPWGLLGCFWHPLGTPLGPRGNPWGVPLGLLVDHLDAVNALETEAGVEYFSTSALSFGWTRSPWYFTQVMKPVVAYLRNQEVARAPAMGARALYMHACVSISGGGADPTRHEGLALLALVCRPLSTAPDLHAFEFHDGRAHGNSASSVLRTRSCEGQTACAPRCASTMHVLAQCHGGRVCCLFVRERGHTQ